MKKSYLLACAVMAMTILVTGGCEQAQLDSEIKNNPAASSSGTNELVTVLNPASAGKMAERLPLVPRLDNLEGKTIYMVDINWGGIEAATSVFEEMQGWFARNVPGANIILRRTQGNMFTDDPGLWQEIGEQGDAAIVGIAS